MATGDSNDITRRVKATIPNRWFAWFAPIRDAILGGTSDLSAWCYDWITYARTQSRIGTATGIWLDIISRDYLGRHLPRGRMIDDIFRDRILATILQERVTRAGMNNALTALTGVKPIIFEPWNTFDAGGYNIGTFAYGRSGGWGSLQMPATVFLTVTRTTPSGVPNVGGYGSGFAGYGVGPLVYFGAGSVESGVTDGDIYDTIMTTKPTGVLAWTRIN